VYQRAAIVGHQGLRNSSGGLAILAAIRRASSLLSNLAAVARRKVVLVFAVRLLALRLEPHWRSRLRWRLYPSTYKQVMPTKPEIPIGVR
jgi:hypothetical protein